MKNTNTKTALSLGLAGLALSAFTANAATVLIDFGRSDNFASGYNGVAMTTENTNNATSGLISLFEGASDTGWDIVVTETGPVTTGGANGGNAGAGADQATFPVALSSFSTTALQDSIYGNFNVGATGGNAQLTITLSGLDNTKTYDLLFYGARQNGQNLSQTWALTAGTYGVGGADVTHDSLGNTSTVVDWNGVSTNGSGGIAFTITGPANTVGALALNFGQITAVPEPATALLGGLGFLCLLRRRR